MDIVEVCEEIKEDMHKIEEDSKKIDCYAILDLIGHCIQCFIDSISRGGVLAHRRGFGTCGWTGTGR